MNYTENYHLPQWDETDRIMRVDFNAAMANIDKGITGVGNSAADGESSLESRSFQRMCRLAYNHYRTLEALTPLPEQVGIIKRDPAADASLLTGFTIHGGTCRLGRDSYYTGDNIAETFERIQTMSVSEWGSITPLIMTFSTEATAMHTRIYIAITCTKIDNQLPPFTARYHLEDLTSGQVMEDDDISLSMGGYTNGAPILISRSTPLFCHHKYRLTITPTTTSYVCTGQIVHGSGGVRTYLFTINLVSTPETGTLSHVFRNPEENHGALIVATYRDWTREGSASDTPRVPALRWNNETVPLLWTRSMPHATGMDIQEAVFARNTAVKDGDNIQFQFSCRTGHDVEFMDWSATLL